VDARAVCCAWREGRAAALEASEVCRVWVRVVERVESRWSFSGFRGTGGAGRVEVMGREMSKGESRREGGGGGFWG
jgi:hypothetical protein